MKKILLIVLSAGSVLSVGSVGSAPVADLKVNPNTGEIVGQANFWTGNSAGIGSALAATFQPLDADLTAIAALSTATFGRSLLVQADAAAARTTLGLGDSATRNVGNGAGTVAAGDDARISQYHSGASLAQGVAAGEGVTAWPASWTGEPFGAAAVVVGEAPVVEGVQTIGVHPWSARLWDISQLTGTSKVFVLGSSGEPETWSLGPTLTVTSGTVGVVASSTSAPGVVQLATDAEIQAGSNGTKAVRPSGLAAWWTAVWTAVRAGAQTIAGNWVFSGTTTANVFTATTATVTTGTVGTLRVTGNQQVDGSVTLGDGAGDAHTINGQLTGANQTAAADSSYMTRALVTREIDMYYVRSPAPGDFTYSTTGTGSGVGALASAGALTLNIGAASAIGQYARAFLAISSGNGDGANVTVTRPQTMAFDVGIPTPSGTNMKIITAFGSDPVTGSGILAGKGFAAEIFPNQTNDLVLSVHNGTTLYSGTLQTSLDFYTDSLRIVLAWDGAATLSAYAAHTATGGRASLLGSVTAASAPTGNWEGRSMYFYVWSTGTANTSDNIRFNDITYRLY